MSSQFAINKLEQGMLVDSAAYPEVPVFRNLPDPLNYRIILYPREILAESRGGIAIPDATLESMQYLRQVGRILAMGVGAFTHPDLKAASTPEPGHWVLVPRHAGEYIQHIGALNGELQEFTLKVVRDVDVLAVYREGLTDVRSM